MFVVVVFSLIILVNLSIITIIVSELRTTDLVSILFSLLLFYFTFFIYLEYNMKKTKYDTITGHITQSQIM